MLVADIVKNFGGLTKMSQMIGIPISTIQSWKYVNKIPSWRKEVVIEAAKKNNISLPQEFLQEKTE